MGLFNQGKPHRLSYGQIRRLPSSRGEYRLRDEYGEVVYVGIAENLKKRAYEHKRAGKFHEGMSIDYMVANPGTTYGELRDHERNSISKYDPVLNQRAGGGGKNPKVDRIPYPEPEEEYSVAVRAVAGLIRFIKIAFKIIIVLAIILAVVWVVKEFIL